MENMTTPAVYHNDSYYHEDKEDEEYDWENVLKSLPIVSVVIFSVVCVLGVSGNGMVIWATGFRMEKTVSTVWYLNLAVADFLVTAFLPLKITYSALSFHWPFGWFMCKMDGLVFFMNMYASIYTLVLISVDRCVCVVCPVWARCSGYRTVRKASWVSLAVWVMALAPSIPNIIFREFDGFCGDFPDLPMVVTNFLVAFVVPFSVIVSCYSVIIYRLRNNRSLARQSGRSFKIIATVIPAFFLCWIPYHIIQLIILCYVMGLIERSVTRSLVLRFGYPVTITLALINSCLNPLLYVCMGQDFKDAFRSRSILKVLQKAFAEEPPQTNNTPTDPAVAQMIALSGIEGSTGPPGTQDPSGDCPV